ncbi:MAG: hypothetical protein ACM3US_09095 [Sphingomonadaceae bacterium]
MPEMDEEELYDYEIKRDGPFAEGEEFFKISQKRLEEISRYAKLSVERTRRICTYPWPDAKIHQRWLDEASAEEIGHWVSFIDKLEASEQQ